MTEARIAGGWRRLGRLRVLPGDDLTVRDNVVFERLIGDGLEAAKLRELLLEAAHSRKPDFAHDHGVSPRT